MRILIFSLAAGLYLLGTFLPQRYRAVISASVVAGWLLHAAALSSEIDSHGALRIGFAVMLSVTLWVSVAAYWLENRNFSLDGLRVLVLPCAAVAAVLPALFPGSIVPALEGKSPLFSWHIVIAMLAYSTLTIAAFHAVLMALQESRLHMRASAKSGWLAAMIDRLPAILTMEKLLFRLIAFGFVLLTLTVLSGAVFSEQLFGKAFNWKDHKMVFTLLSWALFGLLLAGRKWRGWRGKMALRFTLSGFATLLLAYVGSRFVLEVILHRGLT
ncbi:MAG TPA: ABC transporter permease [Oxalobacteraceae bacterium]|jgi:ABC-type uncharacterized transport system permease subunit|nr:ABC transporter permease [Oxalobacteraceae bacterium]HCN91205.1 ABC transporter permease [Oxalobacteraceae bacterium]